MIAAFGLGFVLGAAAVLVVVVRKLETDDRRHRDATFRMQHQLSQQERRHKKEVEAWEQQIYEMQFQLDAAGELLRRRGL